MHDWEMALPSFMSVHIKSERTMPGPPERDVCIIAGTGFIVEHCDEMFLVTNGHIVTGCHRWTDKYLGVPALPRRLKIKVPFSAENAAGEGVALLGVRELVIDLFDTADNAKWLVHPQLGRRADVVAIALEDAARSSIPDLPTALLPYSLPQDDAEMELDTAQDLSVVGFPFGLRGGADSAIWVRGTIASEPAFGFEGEPCFLIDARTRAGQSGSPVIRSDTRPESDGQGWSLVGVYSGRTDEASDLGRVWSLSVLRALLDARQRDVLTFL
ncbi:serine protease [Microbacterium aurugineum]|uniref:Serine protease n=1 Tax=Microbacterium aurugineum TaxID=2851642 RepID=A0ABY4IYF9_9MICO|nr:serine protease [Microbacterium aurugineum]UPL17335.1 serine protease [Microbacterium aurugineum]